MANPEQMVILEQGEDARNVWREDNRPDGGLGDGQ